MSQSAETLQSSCMPANTVLPASILANFTKKQIRAGFVQQAVHVYQSNDGHVLYWRIRLKNPTTYEKWIRPVYKNETGKYVLGEPAFPQGKPLYKLVEINSQPQETVWLAEGEWCVDHLMRLGIVATTSGSADSVQSTDWTPLKSRKIILWPDYDEAGARYADAVLTALHQLKCEIWQVDVAKLMLPPKGDCVDWLLAHPDANKAELLKLPLLPARGVFEKSMTVQKQAGKPPALFTTNDNGVFYIDDNDIRWICSKLEVKALVRDGASENWGRLLSFTDADGHLHSWSMPMEMLKGTGEELRGELLRLGLEIAAGSRARNLLLEYITTTKPETRARCVTRTGWRDAVFVLPDCAIGETSERVIYQSQTPVNPYHERGELVDWQQQVAALCAGNSRLVLAVSCAFASLLLYPAGAESGGIHLVGESSTGKTTALRVAASVYGSPDYMHRWRATANGLEALATLHSDTLLILDELSQVDPKEAGEIAYMLANGKGKTRATKTGAARSRYEWRLLFLSAGEVGLSQYLNETGKKIRAGQIVRLVDISADAGKQHGIYEILHGFNSGAELSKVLVEAVNCYYGTPARAFLKHLTQPGYFNVLTAAIQKMQSKFISNNLPAGSGGQVSRVCERFALIAVAGELATDFGITGWVSGEAYQAATICFNSWLDQRGDTGNQERAGFLAHIQAFFEAHGASRFEDVRGLTEQRIFQRVGFRLTNHNGHSEYFVLPEMFKQEICHGFDPRWAAKQLLGAGMLKPGSDGRAQTVHRLPREGLKRCYHFIKTAID